MQELDSGSYFDCYGDKIKNLSDDLRKQDEELYTKESIDFTFLDILMLLSK